MKHFIFNVFLNENYNITKIQQKLAFSVKTFSIVTRVLNKLLSFTRL